MRPFTTKDGRTIEPRGHEATFRGLHNASKSKVLIYLRHWLKHGKGGQTARQLSEATGVSYDYLRARLSFWHRIRYIDRRAIDPGQGRPQFAYKISERGLRFVTDRIPPDRLADYIAELNLWRKDHAKA